MYKKLTRSRDSKIFGGVCGGLGEYFDTDPLLFRIIFLVLLFIGGGGFLLYLILWIILPQNPVMFTNAQPENEPITEQPQPLKKSGNGSMLAGIILIVLGAIFLVNYYISWLNISKLWPLILVVIGILLIVNYFNNNKKQNENEEK